MRRFYSLYDAGDRVAAVRFEAEHNYNRASREAMYAWMVRWLQNAPADAHPIEKPFHVDPLPDLLVFHNRTLPPHALTADELTDNWIVAAKRQLAATPPAVRAAALRHALGIAQERPEEKGGQKRQADREKHDAREKRIVLVASSDAGLESLLKRAGLTVRAVRFSPFDAGAAAQVEHFETYNRTAASQRVADLIAALRETPNATLVADGDAGVAGLLAAAIVPGTRAVVDVGEFDVSNDSAFLERLYIPGLRRAGDVATAAAMISGDVLVHNAGDRFTVPALHVERGRLSAEQIVAFVRRGSLQETRR